MHQEGFGVLIGTLQHACKVIRRGRSFLRRMIDLLHIPQCPGHHVRVNREFQADLHWWRTFAAGWNGVAVMPPLAPATIKVTSDALGLWGCGDWSQRSWFQYKWPEEACRHHIAFKELFAILLACVVWGRQWQQKRVRCWCDNQVAVQGVISRCCRDPTLKHLLHRLFFMEAHFQFEFGASHISGKATRLADNLSRNCLSSFFSKATLVLMDPQPTAITCIAAGATIATRTRRLDLTEVDEAVRYYIHRGIVDSTHRTCSLGERRFIAFCAEFSIHNPFSVTENSLCAFVAVLACRGLAPAQ